MKMIANTSFNDRFKNLDIFLYLQIFLIYILLSFSIKFAIVFSVVTLLETLQRRIPGQARSWRFSSVNNVHVHQSEAVRSDCTILVWALLVEWVAENMKALSPMAPPASVDSWLWVGPGSVTQVIWMGKPSGSTHWHARDPNCSVEQSGWLHSRVFNWRNYIFLQFKLCVRDQFF